MKLRNMLVTSYFFVLSVFSLPVFAQDDQASLGDIASNIFGAGVNLRQFLQAVCIAAGVGLLLGAILKYKKHRQNPIVAKLSDVIFLVVVGLALIGLAFIPIQIFNN